MSIVAFAGDGIKISSTDKGVTIVQKGESWGDPWPVADSVITVNDISKLIQALQEVQSERYSGW